MAVHYMSERQDWATPPEIFDPLDKEFGFTLDVCAEAWNAKCDRFFSPAEDGLRQQWAPEICWLNPPYGREVGKWVAKAYIESQLGATVVCLVPARTDTGWWWESCVKGEIRFLRGRVKFLRRGSNERNSAPFPSAIVVFRSRA